MMQTTSALFVQHGERTSSPAPTRSRTEVGEFTHPSSSLRAGFIESRAVVVDQRHEAEPVARG